MIRTHFDHTFRSRFGYAVITVDQHDRLLIINPKVVATLPTWVQELISNQMLAMADDTPPGEMAQIIDLAQIRTDFQQRSKAHDCARSASLIATDQ